VIGVGGWETAGDTRQGRDQEMIGIEVGSAGDRSRWMGSAGDRSGWMGTAGDRRGGLGTAGDRRRGMGDSR
jgi:hypothetical protein